jgi:hypothetical protein
MDVADVSAALKETRRIVRPSGTVVISIVHPLSDCGRFVSGAPDAQFVIEESYFGRRPLRA